MLPLCKQIRDAELIQWKLLHVISTNEIKTGCFKLGIKQEQSHIFSALKKFTFLKSMLLLNFPIEWFLKILQYH